MWSSSNRIQVFKNFTIFLQFSIGTTIIFVVVTATIHRSNNKFQLIFQAPLQKHPLSLTGLRFLTLNRLGIIFSYVDEDGEPRNREERSPTPVYKESESKLKPRKRLIMKNLAADKEGAPDLDSITTTMTQRQRHLSRRTVSRRCQGGIRKKNSKDGGGKREREREKLLLVKNYSSIWSEPGGFIFFLHWSMGHHGVLNCSTNGYLVRADKVV